jgi:hypothetical protein
MKITLAGDAVDAAALKQTTGDRQRGSGDVGKGRLGVGAGRWLFGRSQRRDKAPRRARDRHFAFLGLTPGPSPLHEPR